ncbi:GDSL esterase/lipase At3g26430-like [Cynara cardunculus var. scolymus]|uniref:GDSL esterase/lipase At3g26430-like n=1 Tax=Cynara cardunculus var. scolymus TaxID=59895 RepID=UPI000D623665|nr:GDSL esterase/lipase At3g26430-like [Cynara cardunculus var. scolymus]
MFPICRLLISVTLLLPISIFSLPECNFPAIFNFGDSNSDTGGLSAMFGQAPPPNGETFFHSPAGRYCDGRLLIDFIAEGSGLPYLSPFLDSMGTNFSHGANYATAGSTIRRQNTSIFQSGYSPIALDIQYAEFSDFFKRSQIIRQKEDVFKNLFPEKSKFSSALYTFDIGQNDLTAGYKLNMTTEQVEAFVPDVISQFTTTIKNVYDRGGRTFWIHNTGPVGCLPYILDTHLITAAQVDEIGCATPFNEVSQYFNNKLKEAVIELRKELHLAAITYVDIYSVKYSLIGKAKKLGFDDPFLVCCGHGGKYNFNNAKRCGSTEMVDGKEILIADSCEDPSSRILWDGIHFSEAANRWIYGQIANGAFSDPPVPLRMACHKREGKTTGPVSPTTEQQRSN